MRRRPGGLPSPGWRAGQEGASAPRGAARRATQPTRRPGLRSLELDEPGAPLLRLLDARAFGLDQSELRHWARRESERQAGVHVSRSYCFPFALLAWHAAPVGVDIERLAPCDRSFAALICTREEHEHAAGLPDPSAYLTTLWSSKEALSKALGDARDYEPSRLASPLGWAAHPPALFRAAQLPVPTGYTGWVCWQALDEARPAA